MVMMGEERQKASENQEGERRLENGRRILNWREKMWEIKDR